MLPSRPSSWLRQLRPERAFSGIDPVLLVELALLAGLATQTARLVWAVATPLGPIGDWQAVPPGRPAPSPAIFATFDPFFRATGNGDAPLVATSLDLRLFGIRSDRASGRGAAIIGTPDGTQSSIAVGDEVQPGVRLVALSFDTATIDNHGTRETLFLDQSTPAASAAPSAMPDSIPVTGSSPDPVGPDALIAGIRLSARLEGGQVTGFTVQPQGDGEAFRAIGLQPGDVLVAVNGNRLLGAESAERMWDQIAERGQASLTVERGGRTLALQAKIAR